MDGWVLPLALLLALIASNHADTLPSITSLVNDTDISSESTCKVFEFPCNNGTCISTSKYCNGHYDCIDKSDEPEGCTPCNRTLYGETGKTYELEVRSNNVKFPFLCHFNFTALGGDLGDLVQINFVKFNIGRFLLQSDHACVDGWMIITEQGLPNTSGKWCGQASGYSIYYSETYSINLLLNVARLYQQTIGNNFDFFIKYKFLKEKEASIRNENGVWTGDLIQNTYCSRKLYDCDRRKCRIRSPNYPGLYPRNLTCKYYIHHNAQVSNGLHAMIALRQPHGFKLHIKEQGVPIEQTNRMLRTWEQCDMLHDYLSIRDGKTSEAPELARICGGDVLQDVVSSGPDMVVEFYTSKYDTPFHPTPLSSLPGFEIEVDVLFVNSNSHSYVRTPPGRCEFVLSAFESQTGEIESPVHTLPPNTVCVYYFQGRRHETVWVSFIKFHSSSDPSGFESQSDCDTQLRIWDGRWTPNNRYMDGLSGVRNASLIEQICREEVPRLCSRSLIAKGSRPCSTQESYLSTGPDMTLEYHPGPTGTARIFGPFSTFKIRYEFVDNSLGGAPLDRFKEPHAPEPAALVQVHTKSCDRVYRSSSALRGIFRSPSNVFLYGRGGSPNVSCTIRFEAAPSEMIRLTITRARFGGRPCSSMQDHRTGRWHCNHLTGPKSDVRVSEIPWLNVSPLPRDCLCSDISGSIVLAPLASRVVEVKFTAYDMGVDQDFRDFYFEGRYEFTMDGCEVDWEERRLRGSRYGEGQGALHEQPCLPLIQPYLIEPVVSDDSFLVLKLNGFWMPTILHSVPPCLSDYRITVYSPGNPENSHDLCPSGPEVVAYSDGWDAARQLASLDTDRSLIMEVRLPKTPNAEPFDYKFSWMEVYPMGDCPYKCPEIQACISADLWCDGIEHCPNGSDENPAECSLYKYPMSLLHVAVAAASVTLLLSLVVGLGACVRRKNNEKKYLQRHLNNTNGRYAQNLPPLPHHHHHLGPHSSMPAHAGVPPMYMDTMTKDIC